MASYQKKKYFDKLRENCKSQAATKLIRVCVYQSKNFMIDELVCPGTNTDSCEADIFAQEM